MGKLGVRILTRIGSLLDATPRPITSFITIGDLKNLIFFIPKELNPTNLAAYTKRDKSNPHHPKPTLFRIRFHPRVDYDNPP